MVFTGGQSLYEAKRGGHHERARVSEQRRRAALRARPRPSRDDPADQAAIPRPRLGYFGVIDERMDYELLRGVAAAAS